MEARVSYVLTGAFVLLLGGALIAIALWLWAAGPTGRFDRYLVYTGENVYGLTQDSAVTYRGVTVGRVERIALDARNPERVQLLLAVEEGTPVKTDTVATLQMQALTGLVHVNLTGGTAEAPALTRTQGERYPVIESVPSRLGELDQMVTSLLERLAETAERVNALLSETNLQALSATLADLQRLTATLAEQAPAMGAGLSELSAALANVNRASAELPALLARLEETAGTVGDTAQVYAATGRTAEQVLQTTGRRVERFTRESLDDTAALLRDLRAAAANLRRMSETLERNPSVLLYGPTEPRLGPGE